MVSKRLSPKRSLGLLLAAVCGMSVTLGALASDYPERPITLIVPFPPGGSTDVQARLVAKSLTEKMGKPVIVDNRAGAAGAIGTKLVAAAPADGYTLLFASISSLVTEPVLNDKVGFDPLRDFVPISIVSDLPFLLVVECSSNMKSVADLVAAARAQPGKLNYSSWGYGSAGNLLGEMFKQATKVDVAHIPYKGESPAVMGLLSKEVSMMFVTPVNMPHISGGKMCPLAVTGGKRLDVLPNTPTFTEAGVPAVNLPIWFGVVAPAKTPRDIVNFLQKELATVVQSPEFARSAKPLGVVGIGSNQEDFNKRIKSDIASITQLSKSSKLKE